MSAETLVSFGPTPRIRGSKHSSRCAAPNCTSSGDRNPELSFFRFPKDPERCKRWRINSRGKHLDPLTVLQLHKNRTLCSKHFELSQFMNAQQRNRLIWNAVPTIFDVPNPPKLLAEQRTDPEKRRKAILSAAEAKKKKDQLAAMKLLAAKQFPQKKPAKWAQATPLELELRRKIRALQMKLFRARSQKLSEKDRIAQIMTGLSRYLPKAGVDFIETQIRMGKQKSKRRNSGLRWSIEDKLKAHSIYSQSPKAYRVLQKLFYLPSKKTLQRDSRLQLLQHKSSPTESLSTTATIHEGHPSESTCTTATIYDNHPAESTSTTATIYGNHPVESTSTAATIYGNHPVESTSTTATIYGNHPAESTCTTATIYDNHPVESTSTAATIYGNHPAESTSTTATIYDNHPAESTSTTATIYGNHPAESTSTPATIYGNHPAESTSRPTTATIYGNHPAESTSTTATVYMYDNYPIESTSTVTTWVTSD